MSEHTSATWLIPSRSNSVLVLCGLIILRLPSVPGDRPWPRSRSESNIRSAPGQVSRGTFQQRGLVRRCAELPRHTGAAGVIREFIGLPSPTGARAGAGGHPCQGLYHRGMGRKPKVAMIATHYQIDFSEHYLADYMATRGIGFLGWNTRYRGFESNFRLDH